LSAHWRRSDRWEILLRLVLSCFLVNWNTCSTKTKASNIHISDGLRLGTSLLLLTRVAPVHLWLRDEAMFLLSHTLSPLASAQVVLCARDVLLSIYSTIYHVRLLLLLIRLVVPILLLDYFHVVLMLNLGIWNFIWCWSCDNWSGQFLRILINSCSCGRRAIDHTIPEFVSLMVTRLHIDGSRNGGQVVANVLDTHYVGIRSLSERHAPSDWYWVLLLYRWLVVICGLVPWKFRILLLFRSEGLLLHLNWFLAKHLLLDWHLFTHWFAEDLLSDRDCSTLRLMHKFWVDKLVCGNRLIWSGSSNIRKRSRGAA
jgi:hypothetical protein